MQIRPAHPNDAKSIATVHVSAWQTTYRNIIADDVLNNRSINSLTKRWIENLTRPDHFTFVADDETAGIVGFANCGPERRGNLGFTGELHGIYLLAEHRGNGIGTRLFRHAAHALIDELDSPDMMVWVLKANPYRAFYEALGGNHFHTDSVRIGRQTLVEYAYGWQPLKK